MRRHRFLRSALSAAVVCAASFTASASTLPDPPGYTTARTGGAHDFEYFAGGWRTTQHRLKARGVGSNEWDTFPATLCMTPYLDGRVTVDEIRFPTKRWAGFTLRSYDLAKKQWSIWWINSTSGRLEGIISLSDLAQLDEGSSIDTLRHVSSREARGDADWARS